MRIFRLQATPLPLLVKGLRVVFVSGLGLETVGFPKSK